jgi:hypothetical protein
MLRLAGDQHKSAILFSWLRPCAHEDDYPLPSPYEIARDAKRFLLEFDPTRQAEFEREIERCRNIRRQAMAILAAERNLTSRNDGAPGYKPWWIAQRR